jgi:hypothetical protein
LRFGWKLSVHDRHEGYHDGDYLVEIHSEAEYGGQLKSRSVENAEKPMSGADTEVVTPESVQIAEERKTIVLLKEGEQIEQNQMTAENSRNKRVQQVQGACDICTKLADSHFLGHPQPSGRVLSGLFVARATPKALTQRPSLVLFLKAWSIGVNFTSTDR